jgi:riboflavin synthase
LFTGLVETVGVVRALRKHSSGAQLTIESPLADLRVGESVAIDGVCQTITEIEGARFSCEVLAETLRVTNFGGYRPGHRVNLERALEANARLGGHLVNAHVDGTGAVTRIVKKPLSIEIAVQPELLRYLVPKGSVAVNGVSLTVGPAVKNGRFSVFIVSHTWENTNLREVMIGDAVNIEVDIIAKYVERFFGPREGK